MAYTTKQIMKRFGWTCIHLAFWGVVGVVVCVIVLLASKALGAEKYYLLIPLDCVMKGFKVQSDNFNLSIPIIFGYMAFLVILVGTIFEVFVLYAWPKTKDKSVEE